MSSNEPIRAAPDHEDRFPGADRRSSETVINLLRAAGLVSAELGRVLREHDLSLAGFNVLMILEGDSRHLCPAEIGERLLVTRGTVTGLLDSLERRALVERQGHPEDRRMLEVRLTAAGRRALARVWTDFFPAEIRLTASLSDQEKETLILLLGTLAAGVASAGIASAGIASAGIASAGIPAAGNIVRPQTV